MSDADFPSLNLQALNAYAAVMSAGSITGAARLLRKSQPAVTRLIQDLEADVGFALFHRNGPKIYPTEQGVQFHQDVEGVLSGIRHIRERARAIADDSAQPFAIAATSALAAGLVPHALALMAPKVTPDLIHLTSAAAEQVVQSILNRTADVAVCSLPVDHPALELHWIGRSSIIVMVADTDPLAAAEVVRARDLQGRRLITMANPYRLRARIDRALADAGITAQIALVTNTSANAASAAAAGLGVAIVDPATAYGIPMRGVCVRPLEFDIPFLWGVFTATGRPRPKAVSEFIATLETAASQTLPVFRKYTVSEMDVFKDLLFGNETTGRS